jgi:amidase
MSLTDELANLDATAQAELVRNKELTAVELVEATIERIERVNPKLNAVVTPMYEEARTKAENPGNGPFAGVPFLLKDLLASYKGVRMTFGSRAMEKYVGGFDSELVRRLKKAGFIIVGKTNTPEFGILPTTEPQFLGPCRNPWDIERTTGGSSGGASAAVAAGQVPLAHANDGGGSIRIPASCCGIFGLKPTRGRNPLGPAFGDIMGGLVAEHAVSRTVRDSAALLDVTSGPDVGDPYWAPPNRKPFSEEVGADPGKLKIAFMTETFGHRDVHADCAEAVSTAAKVCESLGHRVVEDAPPLDTNKISHIFITLWSAGCASSLKALNPSPESVEPLTWRLYELGCSVSAPDYLNAVQAAQGIARQVARWFVDYDVLMTPTLAEPPVPLGTFDPPADEPIQAFQRAGTFAPFTALFNITGQPAMSVPLFWNKASLPIGVHFVGRFGDEATLFRLASQLEKARPWTEKRPPISA